MQDFQFVYSPILIGLSVLAVLCAGFVKGAVGFGMPMITISILGSFLAPEVALAALIVPTLMSNVWQALRGGWKAAWQSLMSFRLFIGALLVCIALSAQLVGRIPSSAMFLIIGLPVTLFAAAQLFGWRFSIPPRHRTKLQLILGSVAGFIGGISGVWGPPTVAYLTAAEVPKNDHIRVQGVVYGTGALVLFFAHLKSGVLNGATLPLSLWLVIPALAGMALGFSVQDRLDQRRFRRATLIVLIVAGLNLLRRGLT
ncbi:MAG: sulfite exporter TauE/SafE family protein [Paracoccaceae bacterium]